MIIVGHLIIVLNQFEPLCDGFAGWQMTGASSDWELPLQFWREAKKLRRPVRPGRTAELKNCAVEPTRHWVDPH